MVDDHIEDVGTHSGNHKVSEQERAKLHAHINKTRDDVEQDNIRHTNHQEDLRSQILELNAKLDAEKKRQYQKDLAHRNEIQQKNDHIA